MTLYDLIAEARRGHPTPAASRTLDILVVELGRTRDNLRQAVGNLQGKPLPEGGQQLLETLLHRAERERIDDLDFGPEPRLEHVAPPLDDGTAGIGVLLAGTAAVTLALTAVAVVAGLGSIFHWHL